MPQLNEAQQRAVDHRDGPLLILAGAGSGKTRVVTERIGALCARGVPADAIVAVSFTNKAAGEMADRLAATIGKSRAAKIQASTFHSFGLAMIREEKKAAGVDGRFVVFDQSDSLGTIKEILRELFRSGAARKLDPMAVLARISNWKTGLVAPVDVGESDIEYDEVARSVYPEYQARLGAMHALDFDDLVCLPVQLLRDKPALRARWQKRIQHLLVDEFQDTSEVQLELVKLLANEARNVCVVGDDDQSIYSWRGANVGNILEFERHFPGAKVIKLETNYRSRAPILEVANAVIAGSAGRRHDKKLRAARAGGDAVRVCACDSPQLEGQFVAREIGNLVKEGVSLSEVAVLYRSNLQARVIEEELTQSGIPYRLVGGQQFFDRKEVKDTAAYLRVVVNPHDEISLRRIINYPARGVGTRSVTRIEEHAREHGMSFCKAFLHGPAISGIPDNGRRALGELVETLDAARGQLKASGTLSAAASSLVDQVNLRATLEDASDGTAQGAQRYENIVHLLRWLERYEQGAPRDRRSLQDFLQRVTLGGDADPADTQPGVAVTLSTLHAAKGLEFGNVFLIGCVEGQLPHSRIIDPKASEAVVGDLDEERRLFYVGITRARDRLYLSAPKRRLLRGKPVEVTPSRYMDDLPVEHVENYQRKEQAPLEYDEVASLAKDFLQKHRAKYGARK